MTSKIPRRASLTCEEESVLSILGRRRAYVEPGLPVSLVAERPLVTTKIARQGAWAALRQLPTLHERVGGQVVGCGARKVEWQTVPVEDD